MKKILNVTLNEFLKYELDIVTKSSSSRWKSREWERQQQNKIKKEDKNQDLIVLRFSVNSFKWSLANLGDPGMYNFIACAIKSPWTCS